MLSWAFDEGIDMGDTFQKTSVESQRQERASGAGRK